MSEEPTEAQAGLAQLQQQALQLAEQAQRLSLELGELAAHTPAELPASALPALALLRPRWWSLPPRQRQAARLAAAGLTTRQVAAALVISPHTARSLLRLARRRLGLPNNHALSTQLAAWLDGES